ncbi:MAG: T9SS type A sorting domain-containing protein [Sphingobacteriales bacterium JAD_PAG50586_3]|nr:MAG: T9SS type A sorting domain-containing protein [Sphingobacteriales bacterium JAD_PAG50586_3]
MGFNIIPADTSDDYDWSLFNLTYASCSDIFTIDTLQISCSFAGYNGITGANSDTTINIGNNNPKVNVLANETYYLYISFFNDESHGSNDTSFTYQSGYTIDFSISSCAIDSCLQQIITNIPEDKSNILAELYPNPAGNSFTIRLDALKAGQGYNMQLFTSTGALVRDIVNIKESENIVDVSNLATGLYYYRILTTDGKTAAGRFVKE